ncbi:hypothetical protein [Natronoglycomyces albus]|uniref:Lipoprotein n=1 Tax=Natronoglycomyces albus TaxID=2811108 RepID=A0A895XRM3_9ACTN|nr:hypothetical protein [Natronoglycomyces albus]QSB05835.1 hypothetical protein JQS30_02600 [Natronoglycomyces albus]
MKTVRSKRMILPTTLIATLVIATACSDNNDANGDINGANESDSNTAVSDQIYSWEDEICDIFDPSSITPHLGDARFSEGPTVSPRTTGLFYEAISCNSLIQFEDSSGGTVGGYIYLHAAPFEAEEHSIQLYEQRVASFQDLTQELVDSPNSEWEAYSDGDFDGPWNEGYFYSGTGDAHRVHGFYRDGTYVVEVEINIDTDLNVAMALNEGAADIYADPSYSFTLPEVSDWVKDTYIPNLYETIVAKASEGNN